VSPEIRPFKIEVPDDALTDLRRRIEHTRYPDSVNDANWSYGTDIAYIKELADYWAHTFDWRAQEARINRFDQYLVSLDGLDTHFIHQRSPHSDAIPLVVTHGWPGSIVEFLDIIEPLTEPEKFGGTARDAFHVICPSLPGFAYSEAAKKPGMSTRAIAARQIELMKILGYDAYLAQGGDWGSMVSRHMACLDPKHCRAIHLNMVFAPAPPGVEDPMALVTDAEKKSLAESAAFVEDGMGYYRIQSTRPQTLAYALQDSPVGLAAWITEKFRAWTDCDGVIENALSKDQLLTNIALYWHSESAGSSIRIYCEETRHHEGLKHSSVPTGVAIYPKEIVKSPRKWAEAALEIVHWFESERGGHFAAMEQPRIFVEDMWRFKRALSDRGILKPT